MTSLPMCPITRWPQVECDLCPDGHVVPNALLCQAHPDDCPNGPRPHAYVPDNPHILPCCRQPGEPLWPTWDE